MILFHTTKPDIGGKIGCAMMPRTLHSTANHSFCGVGLLPLHICYLLCCSQTLRDVVRFFYGVDHRTQSY